MPFSLRLSSLGTRHMLLSARFPVSSSFPFSVFRMQIMAARINRSNYISSRHCSLGNPRSLCAYACYSRNSCEPLL